MDGSPRRSDARAIRVPSGLASLITAALMALLLAALIAATGGSDSPLTVLAFVLGAISAYFFSTRFAMAALLLLALAVASPLAYEAPPQRADVETSLAVSLAVLLVVGATVLIGRRRLEAILLKSGGNSLVDELTGLANARGLHDALDRSLGDGVGRGSVDEGGIPIVGGVVLVDLDGFSEVNNLHGRGGGDRMLIEVAAALRGSAGPNHTIARTAGDVFAIFAPGTTESGVRALAEKAAQAIAAASVDTAAGRVTVTASAGYAVYPIHAATRELLIAAADRAMYRAKRDRKSSVAAARTLNPI